MLFSGETYYILDLMVQATGYYLWYLRRNGFHCDAFERLGGKDLGLGGTHEGLGPTWIIDWTIFYVWGRVLARCLRGVGPAAAPWFAPARVFVNGRRRNRVAAARAVLR